MPQSHYFYIHGYFPDQNKWASLRTSNKQLLDNFFRDIFLQIYCLKDWHNIEGVLLNYRGGILGTYDNIEKRSNGGEGNVT